TKKTKDLNDDYVRVFENIINELQQIENTEKLNKKTKLDLDKFISLLKTLNSQFVANKELLNSKIKEPSRSIAITSTKEQFEEIEKLIITANITIKKHNDIVD